MNKFRENGQTLIEVMVAAAVGILVVAALTFTTIFSLRNATLAKTSAQATKLAQEGLEMVRTIRDRDEDNKVKFDYNTPPVTATKFSQLWGVQMSSSCGGDCYFVITDSGVLFGVNSSDFDEVNGLERKILISDDANYATQKKITVIVSWSDSSGVHKSELTTILRKL